MTTKIAELERENQELHSNLRELTTKLDNQDKQLRELEELNQEHERLTNELIRVTNQVNELTTEVSNRDKQLVTLEQENTRLTNDQSSATNYQLPVEETGEDSDLIDSISTNDQLPMTTGEDKPTIILHDGSILAISSKQETVLTLLGLIPQTHNLLTSKFLGEFCKGNLADNKGELESLIKQEIDSKGSTIRKTAAILRSAGFMLSGSEGKGFKIIGDRFGA